MVHSKLVEITGQIGVEKDGTKQRLILDALCANHYLDDHENPQLSHQGFFTHPYLGKKEEIHVGSLYLNNYFHRQELPKQFRPYIGLRPVKPSGNLEWLCFTAMPMR